MEPDSPGSPELRNYLHESAQVQLIYSTEDNPCFVSARDILEFY